jgi:hypothetical protein
MTDTKQYIIHKFNQLPDNENGSYEGAIWEKANARHRYQRFYEDRKEANLIAFYLNQYASYDEDFTVSERYAEVVMVEPEFVEETPEDTKYVEG